MPEARDGLIISFLKGMDLHKPVQMRRLHPPASVAAFRSCTRDSIGLFYTKQGTSMHILGINPGNRKFFRYRVRRLVTVLESRCAAAKDTWSDGVPHIANGGGLQYIIPNARSSLEVLE